MTRNKLHVDHTGRELGLRYPKHCRYMKTNNRQSAYAMHRNKLSPTRIWPHGKDNGPNNVPTQTAAYELSGKLTCCISAHSKNI